MSSHDVLIVGAGPIGIACGVEARRANLSHLVIEKGCLLNAVHQFPTNCVFFSTSELLEIGDIPFISQGPKPSRTEILRYYRRVAEHYDVQAHQYETVTALKPGDGGGFVVTTNRDEYRAASIVLAIGFYDFPNLLDVPGEELPKVSHYYTEPHPYYRQKIAIVGGQNSAVEAALELYRNGAEVTLIHRREGLGTAIKYWVLPDIQNRVKEGSIDAHFSTEVVRINEKSITLRKNDGSSHEETVLDNDFVLAMTGYHTDLNFLQNLGLELEGDQQKPKHNPETMETNVAGIYIAGVATGGRNTNRIFIENGREHAKHVIADIVRKRERSPSTTG
jgi:thioredoxin reductase (NADPH)